MNRDALKNIVIGGLVLVVVVGGIYTLKNRNKTTPEVKSEVIDKSTPESSSNNQPARPTMAILKKGDKFADSPIFKMAFQIAPGDISDDARNATIGFNIDRTINPDGSMTVKLTPTEVTYQYQQYTVAPGETLYFVEASSGDDNAAENKDANLRDDYGVLVDANGIVI